MLLLRNIQKEFKKQQIFLIIDNIICILYNLKWTKETVEYGRRLALLFQEGCYPSWDLIKRGRYYGICNNNYLGTYYYTDSYNKKITALSWENERLFFIIYSRANRLSDKPFVYNYTITKNILCQHALMYVSACRKRPIINFYTL